MREGWKKSTLGNALILEYGKGLIESARRGSAFPVYGSAGVVGHHDVFLVSPGPVIVVGRKGTAGAVHWSNGPCWPIDTTYFVKPLIEVEPRFLFYLLQQSNLPAVCAQTGVPGLNRDNAYAIPILIPPLAEQRRIVDLIAAVDAAIEAAEREDSAGLGAADSLDGTLVNTAYEGKFVELSEIAEVVGGITKDAKRQTDTTFIELPYLRVANVQRGYIDLREITTILVPRAKAASLRLLPGDILFNEGGDRDKLGRGWVWERQLDWCVHQNHVLRARLRDDLYDPFFVSMWGNSSFGRQWFEENGSQTTNLASLNLNTLRRFPVPVMERTQQDLFVDLRLAMNGVRRMGAEESIALGSLRSALLSDLLAGDHEIPDSYDELLSA